MSKVFLGTPLYDGRAEWLTTSLTLTQSSRRHEVTAYPFQSSLLPKNCTALWAHALNLRDHDKSIEWFAMLHDDIVPEPFWIDTLIDAANQQGADFISAVSPVKNDEGLTSTALAASEDEFCGTLALSLAQVNHPDFPAVFDAQTAAEALERLSGVRVPGIFLLANTGCMVCRLDRPWCEEVWFSTPCRMIRENGKRLEACLSEDWFFSRAIARAGGKVMVTKLVSLAHYGRYCFRSTGPTGTNNR